MAKQLEIMEILQPLALSFLDRNLDLDTVTTRIKLYAQELEDLPVRPLLLGVKLLVNTAKFFPTISEIRETASLFLLPKRPPALEAWQALLAGDESNELAVKTFAAQGLELFSLRTASIATTLELRREFARHYDQLAAQERARVVMPRLVRDALEPPLLPIPATHRPPPDPHPDRPFAFDPSQFHDLVSALAQKADARRAESENAKRQRDLALQQRREALRRQAEMLQAQELEEGDETAK